MARPEQLLLIVAVYGFGALVARAEHGTLDVSALVVGVPSLVLAAASVHYANEYADYETDALTTRTPFSGGSGALQETNLPRNLAAGATVGAFVLAALATAALWNSLPAVAVGLLGVILVLGWGYSLPPLALAWRGWGELDNALLGGLVLPVYGYAVQTGRVSTTAVAASIPFTLVVFLNLLDTQWPDREADAAVGKFTLAVRWRPDRLRRVYALVGVAAVAAPVVVAGRWVPPEVGLTAVVAVPLVLWGWSRYTRIRSPLPSVAAMLAVLSAHTVVWLVA